VPSAMDAPARGRALTPVWRNEGGGLTGRRGADRCAKWAPAGCGVDLAREAGRPASSPSRSSSGTAPTTTVLAGDRRAPGPQCGGPPLARRPGHRRGRDRRGTAGVARRAPGRGVSVRLVSDRPGGRCPPPSRRGLLGPAHWQPEHTALPVPEVLARLAERPDVDRQVVCSGDACSPNTVLAADGSCSGPPGLGDGGVADRWAELAVATWSTQWNYGPRCEEHLLTATASSRIRSGRPATGCSGTSVPGPARRRSAQVAPPDRRLPRTGRLV
jgi:kanamycin kinase